MRVIEEWLRRLKKKPMQQEKMTSRPAEQEATPFMPPHNAAAPEIEVEKAFAEYLKENYEVPDDKLTAVAGGYDTAYEEQGLVRNVANIRGTVFRFQIGERVEVSPRLLLSRSGVITKRAIAKQEGTGQCCARYTIQLDNGEVVEKDECDIFY